MLLARKGYRVLLVDQATFPSDTISTHHIHRAGTRARQALGPAAALLATGGPRIRRWTFDLGPFALAAIRCPAERHRLRPVPAPDGPGQDAGRRRGRSRRRSARRLRRHGHRHEDGASCGIHGQSPDGTPIRERARIVIGADGRRSRVARGVQAPTYNARPALTFGYYSYWSGVEMDGVALYPREGRGVVAEVTNDGLVYVAVAWPPRHVRRGPRRHRGPPAAQRSRRARRSWPNASQARREAPLQGRRLPFFFRKPYGPGWALVGDAGYHRDADHRAGHHRRLPRRRPAGRGDRRRLQRRAAAARRAGRLRATAQRGRDAHVRVHVRAGAAWRRRARSSSSCSARCAAIKTQIERFLGLIAGTVCDPRILRRGERARDHGRGAANGRVAVSAVRLAWGGEQVVRHNRRPWQRSFSALRPRIPRSSHSNLNCG